MVPRSPAGGCRENAGTRRNLDVYHRRDRPAGVPVVLHFHGGGFHFGNKRREARPLIGHLVAQGMVCASANYRLRPHVGYAEQIADGVAACEWVRSHALEYGGDPDQIFLVGSSAGASCRSTRSTPARMGSRASSAGTATTGI
jgi:acetyl esterase/lipase